MNTSDTLVRMPKLADTLVEGTLGRWLKQVGESVGQGEPLAAIETDKVTTEITAPVAGTLLEVLVVEGRTVPVETVIARIGVSVAGVPPPRTLASPKPTPVAARLLAEHGLAPQDVPARSGRLTKEDVVNFLETPERPRRNGEREADATLVSLTPMRRAIADHLLRARQTIPHGQTVMDADLSRLVAWRDLHKTAFQQVERANLSFTVCFVYALAHGLAVETGGGVDIGVAVALEAGLIVPVVRDAGALSLGQTARAVADLAARARSKTLAPHETLGARMTLSNVGSFGNLSASPIVPLNQIGILGPGLVERRPMPARDGGIRSGWRCRMCLMFDRRVLDDFTADRLLRGVLDRLARISDEPSLSSLASPLPRRAGRH